MKYLLLTAEIDYADEFYCEMFGVFTDEQWKALCEKTKKFFDGDAEKEDDEEDDEYGYGNDTEVYFGTNEALNFSDYKDWLQNFKKKEITKAQYDFLKDTFGKTWGTGSGAFTVGNRNADGDPIEIKD
jgi:crotonobetainyl-CoA:carnitine CoA-transferase CaiB-like acyl-CoA transferase